ncbi:metallophosphoesterase [Sulfitobacter sp. R18_1]|uniref:metallophosphoesterase family protein n=1 Tax=Sulfitobacter sp. R18_1 TaxID=2821104 RepID=UPI001ADAD508|nr:metallophosphoesterase [Sulfitobacter sp. R18_1]MBO9428500.1 metallophosphoesterase [Sulfitobacter sp. R18_1]
MRTVENSSGFLFVGDPHFSSRKPGRRKDKDFQANILKKFEQAITIANERNLVLVILGDMFDSPKEDSEGLKTRLMRALRKAKHLVVFLLGNHDRHHDKLSDDDSVAGLEAAGLIDIISTSGPYGVFNINGVRIGLGGTPHGEEIPTDVSGMFEDVKTVVWLTHHDLALEGAYPNSIPTHEITGCKLVVNGHMHLRKKPRKEGGTLWFNPGNITRQSIDTIEHIPHVYSFNETGKMEAFELDHEKDVFDLTGRLVDIIREEREEDTETLESAFVQLIQSEDSADFKVTDDGSVIRELIEEKFETEDTDRQVRSLVVGLFKEVMEAA